MKTFKEIRESFWSCYPEFKDDYRKTYKQNQYNATIRTAFCMYVDSLQRNGDITESQAYRITL